VLNDLYVPGMVALIKSVKKHNPDFNYEFRIYHSSFTPVWGELSGESVELLDSLYDHFEFIEPPFKPYLDNGRDCVKYLSIESFNIDADKVIFFDADMICLDSLKGLIEFETDGIAMVHGKMTNSFYVGVMVIGKRYLNEQTYLNILKYDDSKSKKYGVDMKLLNEYFLGKIETLPDEYDAVITEVHTNGGLKIGSFHDFGGDWKEWERLYYNKRYRKSGTSFPEGLLRDVKILHYIFSPWTDRGRDSLTHMKKNGEFFRQLWEEYYTMDIV